LSSSLLLPRSVDKQHYNRLVHIMLLISNSTSQPSDLTEATVSQFRKTRVSAGSMLLTPGQQCRVCLHQYTEGDVVRYLPCRHHFHCACIDQWLLHRHPTCPVDGIVYTNESVRLLHKAQQQRSVRKTDYHIFSCINRKILGSFSPSKSGVDLYVVLKICHQLPTPEAC